ncbi:SDR family NAD(P)-dependent oxidoreductase [Pseudomonas sp. LB3P14]
MTQLTVAVVGAGPGLGLAVARRFAREGYAVALIARRRESLDQMVAELRAEGVTAEGFVADITDGSALEAALKAAKERFGPIGVLEFSPVPSPDGDASMFTPTGLDRETMDRLHRLIILGAITCVRAVLPDMQAAGSGSIFLTTSGSAHHVMPVYTPIGMVMAALRSYALCLNEVLSGEGIYVGTVCISVLIRPGDAIGDPAALADRFYRLHQQRDVAEEIVVSSVDPNALHDKDMAERGIDWQRPEEVVG